MTGKRNVRYSGSGRGAVRNSRHERVPCRAWSERGRHGYGQNRTGKQAKRRYQAWKPFQERRRNPFSGNRGSAAGMGSLSAGCGNTLEEMPEAVFSASSEAESETAAERAAALAVETERAAAPAVEAERAAASAVEAQGAAVPAVEAQRGAVPAMEAKGTESPSATAAKAGKEDTAALRTPESSLGQGRKKWLLVAAALACIGAAIVLIVQLIPYLIVRKSVTVQAGGSFPDVSAFLRWESEAEIVSGMEEGEVLAHVEERSVAVRLGNALVTAKLQVVDIVPPEAELSDRSVYAGKQIPAEAFIETLSDATDCTFAYAEEPSWEEIGIQKVIIAVTDEGGNRIEREASLEILEDTTPPVITGVKEITITEGDSFSYEEGITVSDNNDEYVPLKVDSSAANPDVPGDYTIVYTAEDQAGNRAKASTILHVKKADRTPPVIEGVKDITILEGESISYKRGVTVTDDCDEKVALKIDNSAVDTEVPGDYPVIYSAEDEAGNRTEVEAMVHVKEYSPMSDTGVAITEELVLEKADEILESILDDSMSDYEKLRAIYDYVHDMVAYSNGTPKTTWVEGAYYGLVRNKGDCFAYAMSSKCLLTRAGIANIDIERIRMGDSMHFWNLVDIGEGWYHFDTCGRGDGVIFFYWTDEELREYSESHKTSIYPNGSHYYDPSLYPEIQ